MNKKSLPALTAVFITTLLILTALTAACDQTGTPGLSSSDASGDMQSSSQEPEEITEMVWQWPSYGPTGSGFQAVEDALNEMTEKDIRVHITLEPAMIMDLLNQTTLAVTSGEQLDLALYLFSSLAPYISNGLIQPLDDYIDEYGADMKEVCGEDMGGYYEGKLYALPVNQVRGESYGYLARKDILDKYNITIDPNKNYTMDDLGNIFAAVKAGEGSKFYMYVPVPEALMPMFGGAFAEVDTLGATNPAGGVLMLCRSFTDMNIVNLYETDEFEAYAELAYDWAQKGYVSSDALTNTEPAATLIGGGNYLGCFSWSTPFSKDPVQNAAGKELVTIDMTEPYIIGSPAAPWLVPVTSADPAKAVKTMNYIFRSPDAAKLLQFGIEGQDYEVKESNDDGVLIKMLADDPMTLPYYMPFGVYGDKLSWPVVDPSSIDMNKRLKDWGKAIPASRKSPAAGYTFSTQAVSTEYSAVSSVIAQYSASIAAGAVDPASALSEFRSALQDAGIDTVIAENQRQLNEWASPKR